MFLCLGDASSNLHDVIEEIEPLEEKSKEVRRKLIFCSSVKSQPTFSAYQHNDILPRNIIKDFKTPDASSLLWFKTPNPQESSLIRKAKLILRESVFFDLKIPQQKESFIKESESEVSVKFQAKDRIKSTVHSEPMKVGKFSTSDLLHSDKERSMNMEWLGANQPQNYVRSAEGIFKEHNKPDQF